MDYFNPTFAKVQIWVLLDKPTKMAEACHICVLTNVLMYSSKRATKMVSPCLFALVVTITTLVNVYVNLVVFTCIAGTS